MKKTEKIIHHLEEQIPELAASAFKQAYWRALSSGCSVVECEDGALIEIHPDGTKKIIQQMPPPIPVKLGLKVKI